MKQFLILLFFLPVVCLAQPSDPSLTTPEHSLSAATAWQVIARPTVRNPLNAFYRFTFNDGRYFLELKLSAGGVPFVVARNAVLELETEHGAIVTVYNSTYRHSCKGCGSRHAESNIEGVTLNFPISVAAIHTLCDDYLAHLRLHLADSQLGSKVTLLRSEQFRDELSAFFADCKLHQ